MSIELEELRKLPMADKLRVVEELWDDIASSGESIPVDPMCVEEAERRADELDRDPNLAIDREELWKKVDEPHD